MNSKIRSLPGTIVVTGIVIGYIAWLEARNFAVTKAKQVRLIMRACGILQQRQQDSSGR